MRIPMVLSLGVGLWLASSASAQFGTVNPTQIQNKPIMVPDVARPIASPQFRATPSFSLSRFLPSFGIFGGNNVIGRSVFPTPAGMPGKEYLRAFGFQQAVPIQP
jgi:hypothetical protein